LGGALTLEEMNLDRKHEFTNANFDPLDPFSQKERKNYDLQLQSQN